MNTDLSTDPERSLKLGRAVTMETDALAKNRWSLALRGVAAIVFGALALVVPAVTLDVLILLFGAYALFEGVFNVIAGVHGRGENPSWWALLLGGLVSMGAGVVTLADPGLTELALLYVIALWAVVIGVFEIVAAIRLRRRIDGQAWPALNGVLSVVFGVLTMLMPGAGAVSLAWLIGAYAIGFGALLLGAALRLRRWSPGETRAVIMTSVGDQAAALRDDSVTRRAVSSS